MTLKTRLSKGFQTVVPLEIRKLFDIGPGDILEWKPTENGVKIKFRKKVTFQDVEGMVKCESSDAVKLKKKYQRGEKD
jgi:bifunctional DNA-binding transcriptional regulator/antitoxin component of YhaV-PrlF toxin-antitoxin module